MGPSSFRRTLIAAVFIGMLSAGTLWAQEEIEGEEEIVDAPVEVDKSAGKADKPTEPPRHVYSLELLNVRGYKTASLLHKQLTDFLERGATVIKTKSTWSQLVYEVRSSMGSGEIRNALLQMQLEEAKLKSVSFAGNRFTVEVQ